MEGVLCRSISGFYSGIDSLGVFSNNDHIQYYYNNYPLISLSRKSVGVRCAVACGGKMENMAVVEKDCATSAMIGQKKNKKMVKKRSKLLKRLSEDLAMLSLSAAGDGFFLEPRNPELKDASEGLLSQLKKLKGKQKEVKKKLKEERAKSRATNCLMKTPKTKTKAADCASTSSSSSESSDSECEREVVDMSRLKHETNTQNKEDLQLQLPPMIQEKALIQQNNIEQDRRSNILLSLLEKEKEATEEKKKIEVCMGGKCKRSGAGALLEKFQKVADAASADVAVVGCKCMGKCRDGPNVRLVSPPAIDSFGHGTELFHHNHRHVAVEGATGVADSPSVMARRRVPKPFYHPLCIGVGLDDVSFIVSKFVGDLSGVAV